MPTEAAKIDLLGLLPDAAEAALRAHFASRGQPAFRVGQVMRWIFEREAFGFGEMTDLPLAERAALGEAFAFCAPAAAKISRSTDGTAKHLWLLGDDELIESVLIPTPTRLTLCISSQAGCAMACTFCATGWAGYRRQLDAAEIIAQYRGARRWARENGYEDITNIVFMGMGEPLMNWKAVDVALTILNHAQGFGIGARHITVSTVGVLPGIVALAERPEQFRLAISIHAPSDDLRRSLMPVNVKYPLAQVIEAAKQFNRRVTFEYVMLGGVNDALEHAIALGFLAKECGAFVNLIPLHPGGTGAFVPSTPAAMRRFTGELKRAGVEVAVRKSRGLDIAAACGQLRVERLRRRPPGAPKQHGDVQVA